MKQASKSKKGQLPKDIMELYDKILKELNTATSDSEKREKEILLDKLEIYLKGKEIVLDNSILY